MPKVKTNKVKIILTNRVRNLGKRGDVVDVKPGYFRNFLSKGLSEIFSEKKHAAILATLQHATVEKHEELSKEQFEVLNQKCLFFARQASGTEILFAAVTKKDIAQEIKSLFNIEVNFKKIFFHNIIKKIGIYKISIDLSESVSVDMILSVGQTIESAKELINKNNN